MPDSLIRRLDAVATERGLTRGRLVRQVLEAALADTARPEAPDTPDQEELLALLSEKARQGNVAAIRSLLAREDEIDPRQRALLALQAIAEERQP